MQSSVLINRAKIETRKGLLATKGIPTDQTFRIHTYGGEENFFALQERCLATNSAESDSFTYMPLPASLEEINLLHLAFLHCLDKYEEDFFIFLKGLLVQHGFDLSIEETYRAILEKRYPKGKIDAAMRNPKLLDHIKEQSLQTYGNFLIFILQILEQAFKNKKINERGLQKLENHQVSLENFLISCLTYCN